jgi:hypothetical protein
MAFVVTDSFFLLIFPFSDSVALGIDTVISCSILGTALLARGQLS